MPKPKALPDTQLTQMQHRKLEKLANHIPNHILKIIAWNKELRSPVLQLDGEVGTTIDGEPTALGPKLFTLTRRGMIYWL